MPPTHAVIDRAPDSKGGETGQPEAATSPLGAGTLYSVINAVAQGPELGRVLPAVVDLVSEATACHACFVYLVEGERLRMRAASSIYEGAVDAVEFGVEEGICGWVVRNGEPVFLRDNSLSDPRMKVVPELHEEQFQSMVAVPLQGRHSTVIGVIVLHTEAPREFGKEVRDFLVHVASLVAGAIENARLYERERRRAGLLDRLASLVQRMAEATDRSTLMQLACDGTRTILEADASRLYLTSGADGAQRIAARSGEPAASSLAAAPPIDAPARGALAIPLAAADAQLGTLAAKRGTPFDDDEVGVFETIAGQLAVGLRTLDLIERLTEENLVRDLFDAIEAGRAEQLAGRVRSARVDPNRAHVVVSVEPLRIGARWDGAERVEERMRRAAPGALCDLGTERLRVLLPVPGHGQAVGAELARLDAELAALASQERVVVGRSSLQSRLAADPSSITEATGAARIARALEPTGGVRAWDGLGAYRYLVGVGPQLEPDPRHAEAARTVWDYDERRGGDLLATLEHYLADRRIVPTARALYIHPNTLRQRLERVESLTGIVIADEDPVSLELAIKLHRLRAPEAHAGNGASHAR